ncbi:hypothetical protein IKG68_02830 [Candidatus Saccharibacteria bacterium]|nr:hypothetical protein [Candidatus Saccharibacteria bacterium]
MKDILTRFAAGGEIEKVEDMANSGDLKGSVTGIINAIIGILGIVAVIVIIIGGVTYMTSSGDASKVKKAKDTILYGVIGLIVCALAAAIVNFVIGNIIQ